MRRLAPLLPFLLAGCATTWQPLDGPAFGRANAKTMLLVIKPPNGLFGPPPFLVTGIAAVIAMGAEGHRVMERNGLVDPAVSIGHEIAVSFAQRHNLGVATFIEKPRQQPQGADRSRTVAPPPDARPDADVVLELVTSDWEIHSAFGSPPIVRYSAVAKLTDARHHTLLAQGGCRGDLGGMAKPAAKDYDTLVENGAEPLKEEMARLTRRCMTTLASDLLQAPVQTPVQAPVQAPVQTPVRAPSPAATPVSGTRGVPVQQTDDE